MTLGASDKVWPSDSENGFLSYSKMIYEANQNQVRKTEQVKDHTQISEPTLSPDEAHETENVEYVKFPVCKTNTGWFHCSTDYTHSDI